MICKFAKYGFAHLSKEGLRWHVGEKRLYKIRFAGVTEMFRLNRLLKALEEIKEKEWELAGEKTPSYLITHFALEGMKCAFCHSEINGEFERLEDREVCCIPCYKTESDTGE